MKIYNSLTRKKEEFVPLKGRTVGMYVCGPTVYDEAHIGHARSAYVFDVVRRSFAYAGYDVTFVRNVTDVDDKIIDKAKKEFKGEDLNGATMKVSAKYLDSYHADMEALGILPPTKEPKATEYIERMKTFIAGLIEGRVAYASGGDVYFDIRKAKEYGKLSNQSLDKMEIGARVSPGEKKRDGLDFALWKAAKEGEPSWPSPWGQGRPGWHIECSVMSSDILGGEFDIHGGGIDLIFPHHENEIAQSEGAGKRFAKYWMHNGLLTINGEKMAKSLGNYITIKDFLAKHRDPDLLKLLFLGTHYRHPVDYTQEKIEEAKKEKERFSILYKKLDAIAEVHSPQSVVHRAENEFDNVKNKFTDAMGDDFNMPQALASLFELVNITYKHIDDIEYLREAKKILTEFKNVFGLELREIHRDVTIPVKALRLGIKILPPTVKTDEVSVDKLIEIRNEARKAKDFKKADEIRKKLAEQGIILEDTKDGTEWRRKA